MLRGGTMQKGTTIQLANTDLTLNYGGHTLPGSLTVHLVTAGVTHDVPPSLFISQLYYESNWGSSQVAKDNNNWGGFTWTGNPNRPSGVVVSRGTPRPPDEGGYYMKFASVEDYLTDYVYLLTSQGVYNITGHSTFEDSVKGLFIAGGAKADYATVGWEQYLDTMVSVRSGIDSNNDNILTRIDDNPGDYEDGGTAGKPAYPTTPGLPITSPYGWRDHPDGSGLKFHAGIDIGGGGFNRPIYATQSGV